MKTDIANALSAHILETAELLNKTATMYAVNYAKSDDPNDKAIFLRYSFAAEEVRKLHGPACQALHQVESLIPNKTADSE